MQRLSRCSRTHPVEVRRDLVHDDREVLAREGRHRRHAVLLPDDGCSRPVGDLRHLRRIIRNRQHFLIFNVRRALIGLRRVRHNLLQATDLHLLRLLAQRPHAAGHPHILNDQVLDAPAMDGADCQNRVLHRVNIPADDGLK